MDDIDVFGLEQFKKQLQSKSSNANGDDYKKSGSKTVPRKPSIGKQIAKAQELYENFKQNIDVEDRDKRFVFHIYQVCSDTFPDMEAAHLTRLIYLSTFLNYDNTLVNASGGTMTKAMIKQQLHLPKTQFYKFWQDMVQREILLDHGIAISLNENLFFKGNVNNILQKCDNDGTTFIRLYIHGIRELYEKSTTSSHKTLSYLFRILPYVNRKFNIVCFNPHETNDNLICPMNLQDLAGVIGYEQSHIKRLVKQLVNTTFIVDGKEVGAVGIVSCYLAAGNKSELFINPKVYYAGNAHDEVRVLKLFFKERSVIKKNDILV
jgi:hypothetical protein